MKKDPSGVSTWLSSQEELTASSLAKSFSPLKSIVTGLAIGSHRFSTTAFSTDETSLPIAHCEYNDHQEQVRKVYIYLVDQLSRVSRGELSPGDRREALEFLNSTSRERGSVFYDAFQRVYFTDSKKISERAKASALRFCVDFAHPARLVPFLIDRVRVASPPEASAAAVALGEVADEYSVPALVAARDQISWDSVRADLDETISEISSQ